MSVTNRTHGEPPLLHTEGMASTTLFDVWQAQADCQETINHAPAAERRDLLRLALNSELERWPQYDRERENAAFHPIVQATARLRYKGGDIEAGDYGFLIHPWPNGRVVPSGDLTVWFPRTGHHHSVSREYVR